MIHVESDGIVLLTCTYTAFLICFTFCTNTTSSFDMEWEQLNRFLYCNTGIKFCILVRNHNFCESLKNSITHQPSYMYKYPVRANSRQKTLLNENRHSRLAER